MIVVSDTSPLNYLVLIELQDLLPRLFGRILIPAAVDRELRSPAAPHAIKQFMATPHDCLEVQQPSSDIDQSLQHLDPGEREAISLALHVTADVVLLDERRGRQAARDRGLAVSGTLGVLDLADRRGFARLADAIDGLKTTNFRASPRVLKHFGGAGNS
jgi:predicted nucleic acid-binding protein